MLCSLPQEESGGEFEDEIIASLAAPDAEASDSDSGEPSIGGALAMAGLAGAITPAALARLGGGRGSGGGARGSGGGSGGGRGRASGGGRGSGRGTGRGRGSRAASGGTSAQQRAEARAAAVSRRQLLASKGFATLSWQEACL